MAGRVRLTKNLAAGSQSASVKIRAAHQPYAVYASGGFTGSVTLQQTMASPDVADAAATWSDIGTIATDDSISIVVPLYRIRVDGDHSAGTATVDLLEGFPASI